MANKTADIENKLQSLGLSREVVRAAWPKWWSAEAELSPSALNDLKFSISRKLGISPSSLFDEGDAIFVWKGLAKFKGLTAHTEAEQHILANFGRAVAKPLLKCFDASTAAANVTAMPPEDIRRALLAQGAPAVDLRYLIRFLAMLGIPVIYLKVMPLEAKRTAAMAVRVDDRFAILLAKEVSYFAPALFDIAHELGHIALAHLAEDSTIVDSEIEDVDDTDQEEQAANAYAMTLLTGRASPIFDVNRPASNAAQLASALRNSSRDEHIDPGLLAMAYGYHMRQWGMAYGALKVIYGEGRPVSDQINHYTLSTLRLNRLTADSQEFLLSVLGLSDDV